MNTLKSAILDYQRSTVAKPKLSHDDMQALSAAHDTLRDHVRCGAGSTPEIKAAIKDELSFATWRDLPVDELATGVQAAQVLRAFIDTGASRASNDPKKAWR